jgi:hypothetical protein
MAQSNVRTCRDVVDVQSSEVHDQAVEKGNGQ